MVRGRACAALESQKNYTVLIEAQNKATIKVGVNVKHSFHNSIFITLLVSQYGYKMRKGLNNCQSG